MSNETTQTWLRQAATARPSARRIRQVTDRDIVTRYVPRLAGRTVHLIGDPMWYDTRAEAVEAARRVRNMIAAEAKMSNDTTQHTDVRERVAFEAFAWEHGRRGAAAEWIRAQWQGETPKRRAMYFDLADRILALLRTPRGEIEVEPLAAADMERVPTTQGER